jgi:hypothetical protein
MIDKLTFSSAANQRICGKRFGYSSGLVVIDIAVNSQVSFLNPDNIILPAVGEAWSALLRLPKARHRSPKARYRRTSSCCRCTRQAGKLNLDDMITKTYSLEQINDDYRDMLEGNNIRGVIRYTDADR